MSPITTHDQAESLHTDHTPDPLAYLGTDPNARELFTDANNFIAIIFTMLDLDTRAALEAKNPHLWRIQTATGFHNDRAVWYFGFVLALEELSKHPEALQAAVCEFYHRMRETLPPPFSVIDEVSPDTRRKVLQLLGHILGFRE